MKNNVVMATLRLFKAFPRAEVTERNVKNVNRFNSEAIKYGLFAVADADVRELNDSDIKVIVNKFGISLKEMNQTFHKNFSKVANASDEQLLFEQLLHYMTTYGVECLGFKAGELCPVFVPSEKLNLPEDITEDTKILVLGSMSAKEIAKSVQALSEKNVAFSATTLDDIMLLAKEYNVSLDVDAIANKELRVRVCVEQNKVPRNPQDFLRLLCYVVTDNSMMIKNRLTLASIDNYFDRSDYSWMDGSKKDNVNAFLHTYVKNFGYIPLAEIFFQHKKLWLVLKNEGNASIINKVRRLATKHKKPAQKGILDRLTSDASINLEDVKREIGKVSLGKKVSLYNALKFRQANPEATTYRVRNGKMFFKELNGVPEIFATDKAEKILDLLKSSIVAEVKERVEGKVVYIPENVNYVFPTSEKDFVGGIPCGSVAHMGKTATIGVHWENLPKAVNDGERRVDLDLHSSTLYGNFGWNSDYRSEDRQVLFTGDMTDAPAESGGATECFYLGEGVDQTFMFDLCFFNAYGNVFPFKYRLILDASPKDVFTREYILDKRSTLTCVEMEMTNANQKIGFVTTNSEGLKDFVFTNLEAGTKCVPNQEPEKKKMVIDSLVLQSKTRLTLAEVLRDAGATVVSTPPEEGEFVDLSLEQITPTSIISLAY